MMEQQLSDKIIQAFSPTYYRVDNESSQHSGPATESHFKLVIVSTDFERKSLIKRHRMVNELFRKELSQIHALAMHTYTPSEWQAKQQQAPNSPQCAK